MYPRLLRPCVLGVGLLTAFLVSTATAGTPLHNEDLVKMARGGLPDSTIISAIHANGGTFNTDTDALLALKEAGVGSAVIEAMLASSAPSAPAQAASAPAGPTPPSAAEAKRQLEKMAREESRGVIEIVSVRKTNGTAGSKDGVPTYVLDFKTVLRFEDDCKWLYVHIDPALTFRVAVRDRKAGGLEAAAFEGMNPGIAVARGSHLLVTGSAQFHLSERGWSIDQVVHNNIEQVGGDVLGQAADEPTERATSNPGSQPEGATNVGAQAPVPTLITDADFAAQMANLPVPNPDRAGEFKSKTGYYSIVPPKSLTLNPEGESERQSKYLAQFFQPGFTQGGVDGDLLAVQYYRKFKFVLHQITAEEQVRVDLASNDDFVQPRIIGPVPTRVGGSNGFSFMIIGRKKDTPAFAYAETVVTSKKHIVHFFMFSRIATFPAVWSQYRDFLASFQLTNPGDAN